LLVVCGRDIPSEINLGEHKRSQNYEQRGQTVFKESICLVISTMRRYLYCSPDNNRMTKLKGMRREWHILRAGDIKNACKIYSENVKGRSHSEV
jgi:hypothetical protein